MSLISKNILGNKNYIIMSKIRKIKYVNKDNSDKLNILNKKKSLTLALFNKMHEIFHPTMISKIQEYRADKVNQMEALNVRDLFIPKALDTAKGADE
ncbi:hypothetical protein Fmac_008674 [Flemingia macrophylla]|uniref:Uncharacterized protein n=1 Tax=Flemingia macrophylla TaxID=520843 RepID=A0ABD1MY47_9FABA